MTDVHNVAFNAIFRGVGRLVACDIEDTVVVAGTGRSGTSWTAGIFGAVPARKVFYEPLNNDPRAQRAGFKESQTYISPDDPTPELRRYMQGVLTGHIPTPWFLKTKNSGRLSRLYEHISCRKLVVKMIQANRLLQWLGKNFDVRGVIFIVRHPCAVVASQLHFTDDGWRNVGPPPKDELQTGFGGWIPDDLFAHFRPVLESVDTTVGTLAARWCLDHYIPLLYSEEQPWTLLPYERLLTQREQELQRVTDAVGITFDTVMERTLNSRDVTGDQVELNVERQLAKWRRRLTPQQIDIILRIVEEFGLDFYGEQLEPDYERLLQFQHTQAKAAM
jgi:hypothetical protein